jgi:hypothetical protein
MTSLPGGNAVAPAPPTPNQMVATLKQNLAEGQKRLRQYEWVETTISIHQYVPPSPEQIQKPNDAGNMAMRQQPQDVRVEFKNDLQPNDLMALDVDAKAALLSALSVQTCLEKQEDAVTLNVRFGALAGTTTRRRPIWTSRRRTSPLSWRTPGTVRSRSDRCSKAPERVRRPDVGHVDDDKSRL